MIARISILVLISVLVLGGLFLILRPDPRSASPTTRSLDLEIRDDGMSPEEVSVREGDRVIMSIDSERPVEIHVHGYDLEREVEPGEATELAFEADLTGRFPIENHETETELGVLVVEPR
jgi:Cupredoxin-like domain